MSDIENPLGSEHASLMQRYRHSLGAFIHDFSILEVTLFRLLCAVAQLTDEIGFALLSGARADALIQHIRRCYRARHLAIRDYLEAALGQATAANKIRNIAVHYVTLEIEDEQDEVLAFNDLRYLPEHVKQVRLKPETLDDIGKDCRLICAVLTIEAEELISPGSTGGAGEAVSKKPLTWHYRPPQQ